MGASGFLIGLSGLVINEVGGVFDVPKFLALRMPEGEKIIPKETTDKVTWRPMKAPRNLPRALFGFPC